MPRLADMGLKLLARELKDAVSFVTYIAHVAAMEVILMKKTLTILAFVAGLPAGAAFADDDCFVPMAEWQPREAVQRLADGNGWIVRRIKIDDGCYEIDGADTQGRRIEVTVHPSTLQIMELEYDQEGRGRSGRSDR